MSSTLTHTRVPVKRGLTPKLLRLKAKMRRLGITYWDVAQAAQVSEPYVWMALAGRRRAVRVITTAERLCAEKQAAMAEESNG